MVARKDSEPDRIAFECDGKGLDGKMETHMHRGTIQWVGDDHIRTSWVQLVRGSEVNTVGFELVRKKQALGRSHAAIGVSVRWPGTVGQLCPGPPRSARIGGGGGGIDHTPRGTTE